MMIFASCGKDEDNNNNTNNGGNNGGDNPGGGDTPAISGFDENGASIATFSVGEGRQIRFSRGNLQYRASTNTWRFAEHQYDYVGEDNANISATYDGWIDLFGWGTSGWNNGNDCYQPWTWGNGSMTDFFIGGDYNNDLTGNFANADWGVYNAISNGGNHAGMWRTMTSAEWEYLIGNEGTRVDKCGYGFIDNMYNGVIILPDSWQTPEGLAFVPINFSDASESYVANSYTAEEWGRMEEAGAIFLPTAGRREGNYYDYGSTVGGYWSSSTGIYSDYGFALYMRFDWLANPPHIDGWGRDYGTAVRLVRAE